MKILLLSSSPRKEKSRTFLLAEEILKGCCSEETLKTETVHLCDLQLTFCKHCEKCHKRIMDCPIKDDVNSLLEKMLAADGIILASPNYINQVTGSMKVFFDRSSHFIHCKRMIGKYFAGAVTSGSGYDSTVLDYMKYYANTCSAQFTGGVSSQAPRVEEKLQDAFQLGKNLASDIRKNKEYPEQMQVIARHTEHFRKVMEMRKNDWVEEYQYWHEMKWL